MKKWVNTMSYCRWGQGDVYLFSDGIQIFCSLCTIEKERSFKTRTAAIEHLRLHRLLGHDVPESAFEKLQEELELYGDFADKWGDE